MFDYEILRLIWWVLIGILLIGFAVTDGFDLGVGALALVLGKNDTERRIMLNTIALTGMETKFGLLPQVVLSLLLGLWCMRRHSLVSTWRCT